MQALYDFVTLAERNRKYPTNTAQGLRAALKLFEPELSDKERLSPEVLLENLELLFDAVVLKNKQFSMPTLLTYKSRLHKVLTDYIHYGTDTAKFRAWTPKLRKTRRAEQQPPTKDAAASHAANELPDPTSDLHTLSVSLRPNSTATMIIPKDLTTQEAALLQRLLQAIVETA